MSGPETGTDDSQQSSTEIRLLCVDTPDEIAVLKTDVAESESAVTIDAVSDAAAARDALASGSYDCVVVELAVGDQSPATVVETLRAKTGEQPLIAYTDIDIVNLSDAVLETVTTVVQKGDAIHRRFLLTKIQAAVRGDDDDETRYEALCEQYTGERTLLVLTDDTGTTLHTSAEHDALVPEEILAAAPDGTLDDRLEWLFTNGEEYRERFEQARAGGETVTGFVGTLEFFENETRYYACWSVPVDGGLRVEFYRELTKRVECRRELEKFETTVELARDGLSVVDENAQVVYCNQAYADMLGYEPEDLIGKHAYTGMEEGALQKGQRITQEGLESPEGQSETVEMPIRTRDGERLWLECHAGTVPAEDGSYGGLVNVARDVTQRKERQQRLEAQQEQLEETNEQLDRIAETISAEFRTSIEKALKQVEQEQDANDADFSRIKTLLDRIDDRIDEHLAVTPDETDMPGADVEFGSTASGATNSIADSRPETPQSGESAHADTGSDGHEPAVDSASADDPATESDVRLRVLHLESDERAQERVAGRIADEPDITVHAVETVAAARTQLNRDDYDCIVADPETVATEPAQLHPDRETATLDWPLVIYTEAPSAAIYKRLDVQPSTVVEKGGEDNRSFLVEKLRSLTGVGRPDDIEIPWQADPIDMVGTDDPLLAALVADGKVIASNRNVETVFPGVDTDTESVHDQLAARLANGDQYEQWLAGSVEGNVGSDGLLCELPTGDGRRFYLCWRTALPEESRADAIELYREVTTEVDRQERVRQTRTLLEQTRDGIHILDENANIVYINDAEVDILGYPQDELIGSNITQWMTQESLQRGQQAVQNLIENPDMGNNLVEIEYLTKSGETRTTIQRFTLTPFDTDGSYTGLISVVRDVTERRERQRKLRRSYERLRRTNQLLNRFGSIVSHDLRNPLNVATLRTELAAREGDSAHLTDVVDALDRMETMLDEFLAFARMGGRIDEWETIDLCELARDAWETVNTERANLVIQCEAHQTEGDRAKLRHVFENLFRNAIEHGGETVTVYFDSTADGFFVADDGPGIPEDAHEKVFEYGYSGVDGTGIGLAVVKDVIHAHGWEIAVTEGDEGGARFDISEEDSAVDR